MYGEDKINVSINCYTGNLTMEKGQRAALQHHLLNKFAKIPTQCRNKFCEVCRTGLSGEAFSKDSEFVRSDDDDDDDDK